MIRLTAHVIVHQLPSAVHLAQSFIFSLVCINANVLLAHSVIEMLYTDATQQCTTDLEVMTPSLFCFYVLRLQVSALSAQPGSSVGRKVWFSLQEHALPGSYV